MTKVRDIIEAYFSKNQPEDLQKSFVLWLCEARDSLEKDEVLFGIWENIQADADASTEQSFRDVMAKASDESTSHLAVRRAWKKWSRAAAVLLLPLLSMALTYVYMQHHNASQNADLQWTECIVPNGELRSVTLPDSSKVQLNAGSILIYPQHFGRTRQVYLNGEAYFSVTHNRQHPFIVKTGDLNVEVLGTVFDVSAFANDEQSFVTLESGKVNVQFRDNRHPAVTLSPNEQVCLNHIKGTVEKRTVNVAPVIAWTQGNLIISRLRIEEIARIIERKYNLKVYVNSGRYPNELISMKLMHDEGVSEMMEILQDLVPKLKYKIDNDELYIY